MSGICKLCKSGGKQYPVNWQGKMVNVCEECYSALMKTMPKQKLQEENMRNRMSGIAERKSISKSRTETSIPGKYIHMHIPKNTNQKTLW